MRETKQELLEKLRFELAFIENGGYGQSVRTPHTPTSPLRDSPSCLNFADSKRTYPCSACWLIQYVPAERRNENIPCHHIQLDAQSSTIAKLNTMDRAEAEEALKMWLRERISEFESA